MKIALNGQMIEYELSYKSVKNINLRILPSGEVLVSAPKGTEITAIEQVFHHHSQRILEAIKRFDETKSNRPPSTKLGEDILIFGEAYHLLARKNRLARAVIEGNELVLEHPNLTPLAGRKLLLSCIGKMGVEHFSKRLDLIYPAFSDYDFPKPTLELKVMKSRWGSCHLLKGHIVLNTMLYALPMELGDYVLCHELCHLVHGDHSKKFYALLTKINPDSVMLREKLKQYSPMNLPLESL